MQSDSVYLLISNGYSMDVRYSWLPLAQARSILLSGKQHHYTSALRSEGDQVTLEEHLITCPSCGFSQSATPHFFGAQNPKVCRQEVDSWAYGQGRIGGKEGLLKLHDPVAPVYFQCPICEGVSQEESRHVGVKLTKGKGKIKISCKGTLQDNVISEELELNFRRGRGIFTQRKLCEPLICIRDITEEPGFFQGSFLYQLLGENLRVRKTLYRRFRDIWGQKLPYGLEGMRPETFVLLTRFLRYPAGFFEAIPWLDCGAYKISPHFSAIAKKLHDGRKAQGFLASMQPLYNSRSLRRLLTEQPGFLFYAREIMALFQLAGEDPAAVSKLLKSRHGFWLVAQLAAWPRIRIFLEDYLKLKGMQALMHQLNRSAGFLRLYAMEYGCMEKARQLAEQKNWVQGEVEFRPGPGFSVPLQLGKDCRDSQERGYQFRYMRSTHDLRECGEFLRDPLLVLQREGAVVSISRRNGDILGVAWICGKQIVSAEDKDGPLSGETRQALAQWAKTHGYRLADEENGMYYF